MKKSVIAIIEFYRKYLSIMKLQCCRYYPSCSQYTIDAVQKYGVLAGMLKGFFRLMRCHPFSKGGYDPA